MNKLTFRVLSALFVAFFSLNVLAQTQVGTVTGSVEGAGAGTVVVAVDTSRGVERAVSAADGTFEIDLAPGSYEIQVRVGNNIVDRQNILVRLDTNIEIAMATSSSVIDEILVRGERIAGLETGIAESGIVVTAEEIEVLPISRSLTSVAMLATGATAGISDFGGVSFSGSSVAENQTYINGLSVTNFRTGVGFGYMPFEMFAQMQAKTGAYGAQFGRSTGGVINAVTKSGSNDFRMGVNYNTNSPLSESPDTFNSLNSLYESTSAFTDIWASGPIIRDRLFYYALVQQFEYDRTSYSAISPRGYTATQNTQFTGLKLDGYLTDSQKLELTFWENAAEDYKASTWSLPGGVGSTELGSELAYTTYPEGGQNYIFAYSGNFGAMDIRFTQGHMEADRTVNPSTYLNTPAYYFAGRSLTYLTDWSSSTIENGFDTRDATRLDVSLDLGNHNITVGIDSEDLEAENFIGYSGVNGELWYTWNNNVPCAYGCGYNLFLADGGYSAMQVRYRTEGTVTTLNDAYYIHDTFNLTQNITIEAGFRNDRFENKNADGDTFITLEDQWAPRLSVVYDDPNTGARWFANYGQYYLPIATNTNIRQASYELYDFNWYEYDGTWNETTQRPNGIDLDASLYNLVYSDGSIPDPRSNSDANIKPMYQSEIVGGVEFSYNGLDFGVKGMVRKLAETIEDIIVDPGVRAYFAGTEYEADANYWYEEGTHVYVLTNPGSDVTFYESKFYNDFITVSAEDLMIPKPSRTYKALEFTMSKPWNGRSGFFSSYTFSKSYGNYEGWVRSDNGQDDAGITSLFDTEDMTRGSYGYLPNDRRHTLKAWGNIAVGENLTLGMNMMFQTGAPKNCFGNRPGADAYADSTFYCGGRDHERGDQGRTPNYMKVDVNAQYTLNIANQEVILTGTVYNVLDQSSELEYNNEESSAYYNLPYLYQSPRTLRVGFRYNFN